MPKVTRLHEHLAAEKNVTNEVNKLSRETISTFDHKTTFFDGQIRVYTPREDEGEQLSEQSEKLRASVVEKLEFLNKKLANFFDFKVTKESTNTLAKADLVYNGTTIALDVPATALLSLENNLAMMRDIYKKIPTRDISEDWTFDNTLNIFKGKTKETTRTEKVQGWKTVVPATERHPAQIKETVSTKLLGTWETTMTSGRLSTIEKAALLQNIDAMIVAVKQARARANQQEIVKTNIGNTIVEAIFDGVIKDKVKVDRTAMDQAGL